VGKYLNNAIYNSQNLAQSHCPLHYPLINFNTDIYVFILFRYGYVLNDPGSVPGRGKIFLSFVTSRSILGLTHPLIQWVPGVISWGLKRLKCVKLTPRLHLVPRSRMSELYLHSPTCLHGVVLN
jgi:hypothetical protein